MLLQLYKTDFGESYITVVNYNVPIDTVRRVAPTIGFLGLEFGKTDFRASKKVIIGFLQVHLCIGKCQAVHLFKPLEFLFILGRSVVKFLFGFFV